MFLIAILKVAALQKEGQLNYINALTINYINALTKINSNKQKIKILIAHTSILLRERNAMLQLSTILFFT
jgi:hypothetical protein